MHGIGQRNSCSIRKEVILEIIKMTPEYASLISTWKYEGIYSFYDGNADSIADYMDGTHYVCINVTGDIIGYYCFGQEARIPTIEEYVYNDDFLDVGLGLRPDLCGAGLGLSFFNKGIEFACKAYNTNNFRLSVAVFNERAIKVYQRAGFIVKCEVTNAVYNNKFYIMKTIVS